MPDVSYIFDKFKNFSDIKIVDGDIFLGDELQTAIEFSAFSNARTDVSPEDGVQDSISKLQGWWADSLEDEPLGSEAWIYRRTKIVNETLNGLKEKWGAGVQWLIDDGVVASIDITVVKSSKIAIASNFRIIKPDTTLQNFSYEFAWEELK